MNEHWSDEYARMLADCEKRESKLSDWERTFVDSLGQHIARGRTPTPKQTATLDAIWERVTA
jgi:hypothetical protein